MCVKLILQASTWTKCPPGSSLPNVKSCQRCIKRWQISQFWRDFLPSGRHEAPFLCVRPRLSSGIGMSLATQKSFLWKYSFLKKKHICSPFQSVGRTKPSYPGDLHRDPGHNWFCWQHLLVPLHNCLWPQPQGFRPFFFCKYFTQALLPNNFLSSRWSIGDRARFTATQTPMASRRLRPSSLRWASRQSRLTILPLQL